MRVIVHQLWNKRSLTNSFAEGIKKHSDHVVDKGNADVVVFYGKGNATWLNQMSTFVSTQRHAVVMDFGYWDRVGDDRKWKVTVDGVDPDSYIMDMRCDNSRFDKNILPWNTSGDRILVAATGPKSNRFSGFSKNEWEIDKIRKLKCFTDREIIYRPKPSSRETREDYAIDGTTFSPREENLNELLKDCWCTVSHHSNVSIDGLLMGIPCYCEVGAGSTMSSKCLEKPIYPNNRQQFFNNLSYCQWSEKEMRSGECWEFLKTRFST